MVPLLWKIVWLLNIVTVWLSSSLPRCILERNEDRYPHKNLYMNVHSIVIQNSNKVHELRKNFQMYKLDIEKAEEPEIKWPTSVDHRKSKRIPEKHLLPLYWLHQSLWLCRSKQTGKFKRWEYQTTWLTSWEICMQVKKQQLELDTEQWTGSKLGKEYIKAIYCHLLV